MLTLTSCSSRLAKCSPQEALHSIIAKSAKSAKLKWPKCLAQVRCCLWDIYTFRQLTDQTRGSSSLGWAGLVAASLLWSDCLIGAIMWPLVPASHRHPFPARPPPAAPVRALGQPVFTQHRSPGHCIQLSTQIFPLSGLKNVCKCLLNQIYKKRDFSDS